MDLLDRIASIKTRFVRGWAVWVVVLALLLAWPAWSGCSWYLRQRDLRLMQQAIRLSERGQIDAAALLCDQILARKPADGPALLLRGNLARDRGDTAAAAEFWRRVPDVPAEIGAQARSSEGALLLEANRAADGEAALVKAISLDPAPVEPHELLADLFALQLRAPEAVREMQAIPKYRDWKVKDLYRLVNAAGEVAARGDAIPHLEQFIAADSNDRHSLAALGQYYLRDDRLADATAVLRRALNRDPANDQVCALLAEAQLNQNDLPGALRLLHDMTPSRDSPPAVWKSCGLCLAELEDWPGAAACLGQAVALQPNDRQAVVQLALALERTGEATLAQKMLQRAERLVDLKSAMHRFQRAPHDRPEVANSALMRAAECLTALDRRPEAMDFYRQVLASNPNWPRAREMLDELLIAPPVAPAPERNSEAEKTLDRALAASVRLKNHSPVGSTHSASDTPAVPALRLTDRHREAGVDFQYDNGATGRKYLLETTGGGVAVLDYDADGWPDLYFPQGGPIPFPPESTGDLDRLYRNQGDGTLIDVTLASGIRERQYSQGCAAADFDNDGFTDLAVANCGTNVLFRNNGDGTFTDVTPDSRIAGQHWSSSLAWGDLNRDGNLDLYVANYVLDPLRRCRRPDGSAQLCHPQIFDAEPDVLYVSRGDGTFDDLSQPAGIDRTDGRGLGVVIADLDDDGWPDIYVANDASPCFLFRNEGRPAPEGVRFAEIGFASGTAVNGAGSVTAAMGIACADWDGDGRLDLYVSNFRDEPDILYLNRGAQLFEDATQRAGLAQATRPLLGWGTQAIDVDLDGRPEIFLTNGHLDDLRSEGVPWQMPPQLFYNLGAGRFQNVSNDSGEFFHGAYLGRGAARLDWNRDGLPDIVVVHHDRPVALLQNETASAGRRVIFDLHGVQANRDAIGTRLRVKAAGQTQVLEICGGDGYCATNERRILCGVGKADEITTLEISWPSGRTDRWTGIPADHAATLIEGRPPILRPLKSAKPSADD